jgi:hypothetical protein
MPILGMISDFMDSGQVPGIARPSVSMLSFMPDGLLLAVTNVSAVGENREVEPRVRASMIDSSTVTSRRLAASGTS